MPRQIDYLPVPAHRVLIVVNPSAGSGANRSMIEELQLLLSASGLRADITSDLDFVAQLGVDPVGSELRAIVAAGGDGTVSAVVNRTTCETPVAILPLGTENLLAKYLGMLGSPRELAQAIVHGATVRLDAGEAAGRVFLLMAGCGFDAEVVRRLHGARTGHIHHLSYVKPILSSIRRYTYPTLRVHYENAVVTAVTSGNVAASGSFSVRWLFVINLPRYAGGLRLVPQAVGTDGVLDVCGFKKGSFFDGLRYLSGVVRGKHLAWPDCRYVQATRLRIESDEEVPYQLDGDPGGMLPVDITMLPSRVRLLVTETWAIEHGFRHGATLGE